MMPLVAFTILFTLMGILPLVVCSVTGLKIHYGLAVIFLELFVYALVKGKSLKETVAMSLRGLKTVRKVLLLFVFIGILTGLWRACGSTAFIVYHAIRFLSPKSILVCTFLLSALVCYCTGTSSGTSATVGIVCMAIASGIGFPTALIAGAVVAGDFIGDRCSPLSSSAILITELTHTKFSDYSKDMFRTMAVPVLISTGICVLLGIGNKTAAYDPSLRYLLQQSYNLSALDAIPIVAMIAMILVRIPFFTALIIGTVLAILVTFFVQGIPVLQIAAISVKGFHPEGELALVMSGGGMVSMVGSFLTVAFSSCCSGILKEMGFIDKVATKTGKLGQRIGEFPAVLLISTLVSIVSCSQTLSVILTHQLSDSIVSDKRKLACHIGNSAIEMPAFVPWSIAASVQFGILGAPFHSVLFSFSIILIPLWNLLVALIKGRSSKWT